MDIIALLKSERDKVARQLSGLDTAIQALSGFERTGEPRGPRRMSAAARAKISASQRARWAKQKGQKVVPIQAGKPRISAAGLANITTGTPCQSERSESRSNRSQAPHLGSRFSADSSGKLGKMGES